MMGSELTAADVMVLNHLRHDNEVCPTVLARDLGLQSHQRGNFARCFRRVYNKGFADLRVTREALFYRITPAGRAALAAAEKGGER